MTTHSQDPPSGSGFPDGVHSSDSSNLAHCSRHKSESFDGSFNDSELYGFNKLGFKTSHPLDRLAANVIDIFIVLGPFLLVLAAPFKRILQKAILLENIPDLILVSTLCLLTCFLFSFMYKTYLTWHYGGTLGQLFMSLRVVNIWEPKEKKWGDHILRSIYWIFSYVLLGLPFLSIMSNEKRRCFHDRVSDTVVLSLKGSSCQSPSPIEKNFVRLALVCALVSCFLILLPQFYLVYDNTKRQNQWAKFFEDEDQLCSDVGEALSSWPEEKGLSPTRLSVAMALYAAGEIEEPCLKDEVDFVYRSGVESAMAHLASAFVYADNTNLSDKYLMAVCKKEPHSESCRMSHIIKLWSDGEWDESLSHRRNNKQQGLQDNRLSQVDSLFRDITSSSSVYVTIWGVRHLYRNHQYEKAIEMLKSIYHVRPLNNFLGSQFVKLQWLSMRTNEARTSAQTAMMAMSQSGQLSLSNWLCFEERANSCERQDSCDYMEHYWNQHPESLRNDDLALTFLKNSICKNKNYEYVKKRISAGLVNNLVLALASKNKKKSLENYLEIHDLTPRLRAEALRELISIDSIKDLGRTIESWLVAPRNWEWEKTGRVLFQRLFQLRVWARAYEVGLVLLNRHSKDTQLQEKLIVAAYGAKKVDQAQRMLSDYYRKKGGDTQRSPTSHSSFSRVARQLESLENK